MSRFNNNGLVVYEGPSMLNGEPIIAILTGLKHAKNRKTGDLLQLWILVANNSPVDAIKTDEDVAVCGHCPHRGSTCYVNVGQAPLGVWRAWRRQRYDHFSSDKHATLLNGRIMRLGAYGDPAALPRTVIETLTGLTIAHTGYTHQWRLRKAQYLKQYTMASCDSPAEQVQAAAKGWRTFTMTMPQEALPLKAVMCPAQTKGLQCEQCKACDGLHRGQLPHIQITVHGLDWKVQRYTAMRAA